MLKQPWRAVFLSYLFPGVGQIYAGAPIKGIIFIVLDLILTVAFFAALVRIFLIESLGQIVRMFGLIVLSIIALFIIGISSLFDAHWTARKFNRSLPAAPAEKQKKDPWLAVFLAKLFPGLGHFYSKQILKGFMFLVLYFLVRLAGGHYPALMLGLIPLALFMYKDAFESAEEMNGFHSKFFPQLGKAPLALVLVVVTISSIPFGPIVKRNFIEAFKIPSASMNPSLIKGDHILVNKTITPIKLKQGDIIVFRYPQDRKRNFIKRIVALGGETIEGKDKVIYVNGVPLDEPYAYYMDAVVRSRSFGPIQVPPNTFFVLGDNRDNSQDSRHWGAIPAEDVIGRAFKIYWSWDSDGTTVRWDRIGMKLN